MGTARYFVGGHGTSSLAAIAVGGLTTASAANHTAATEEFNNSFQVVTPGAWASGGNINSLRYQMGGCGILTAGLAFGGYEPGGESGKTEEYDGTSWTESGDLGTSRYVMANGSGTQTAGLCVGGRTDSGGAQSVVEEYNGSTWSEVTNIPGTRVAHGSAGPQTAALVGLGSTAPGGGNTTTTSFHYDGTNWTSGGTANTARNAVTGTGTQTAAIFAGGSPKLTNAEEYDGSSWTAGGSMIFGAHGASASGTQTAALYASGGNGSSAPSATIGTQLYNGSVFATQPTLASTRGYAAGFGTSTASVVGSGLRTAGVVTTEEYTAATTTDTAKTIDFD